MTDLNSDIELDTTGLRCPEPLMMLHQRVRHMKVGQTIKMLATDPSTQKDVAQFCEFLSHTLLHQEQQGVNYVYWIEKGQR